MLEKGPLNRLFPLANYINCDPLSDHSKSKAQTNKVQQPCHTLPMPLAEINYSPKQKQDISFSSLPDGKSASRNKKWGFLTAIPLIVSTARFQYIDISWLLVDLENH